MRIEDFNCAFFRWSGQTSKVISIKLIPHYSVLKMLTALT